MRIERSSWLKEVRVYPARKPTLPERNAWYDRGFLWSGQYFYAPDTAANVAKAQASIGAKMTGPEEPQHSGLEFDWDDGNRLKSWLKHDIAQQEAESVFLSPDVRIIEEDILRRGEQYYIALGTSYEGKGRILRITYCIRYGNKIRIVSARPASRKERASLS